MTPHMPEKMKELFEIARSISAVLDVDSLLKRIGSVAESLLGAEASSIMLLDEDGQTLSFKVASGEKGGIVQKMKIRVGQGIAGTVAQDRRPLLINDVSRDPRFTGQLDQASGFVTRSALCVPMVAEGDLIGVMEVLNKADPAGFTAEDTAVLESLASLAAVSIVNARLVGDQRNFFVNVIELLITAIESRDPKLAGHAWKVAQSATVIAKAMNLPAPAYRGVYYGALLHDIGILAVRDTVCMSDGIIVGRDQNPEMTHPRLGAELIKNINVLASAIPVVRHHHEHFDGTGYPDALAGDAIPLGARIVAVAEALEELRTAGIPDERVRQVIERGAHTRFDPSVVDICIKELLS